MTAKQKAFIAAYAGNATEAAIKAGYSAKTAYSVGQRLLKNVEISRAIHEREEKRQNSLILNREARMQLLTAIANNADEATKERIKAVDVLNKMSGEYLERVKVETNEGTVFRWQNE